MKKLLFTVLGLGFLSLSAQQVVNDKISYNRQELKIVVKNEQKESSKRALGTGWFSYVDAYDNFYGNGISDAANAFISWIQPDTNLNLIGSTGTKSKIGFHILGRVNDPRDEVYSNTPVRFSRHNTYTWDSIKFTQFYIRQVDSVMVGVNMMPVVDTVFIQYFVPAGLDNGTYTFNATPTIKHYYTVPKTTTYNVDTRLNSSAWKTDTIFLTKDFADSIDFASSIVFGRGLTIPVGATITQSPTNINANLAAHTIFFKPMIPTVLGDTGLAFNNSTVFNKHNMYGLRLFSKEGVEVDNTNQQAQNNSIIGNFQVVDGQSVNGFKSYLPGGLFTNTIFEGTSYHLTSNTVSVETIDANGNGIGNIYPNPSNSSNEVFVPVKISNNQTVTLTICDITGKVVKTISADYSAGDFDVAVSTIGMSKGIYTCTMVAGDFKATSKFILN